LKGQPGVDGDLVQRLGMQPGNSLDA
jgi:hypothetical protein